MAAVGSAFGLGTLWRFPYITGVNGGGAFVVLYVFFVVLIALPVLIAELMIGRRTGKNIIGAMKYSPWVKGSKKWAWIGRLGILASLIILSYYTVVSGWVIHFVIQAVLGRFTEPHARPDLLIDRLSSNGYLQMALASVHLIATTSIVAQGVRDGIERISKIFMPILFVVLGFMIVHSLFLPGATEALRFLFYPDFSKLTATSVIEALGHSLYTVSLGFGAMIVYGSYLKKDVHIPSEAVFVVSIDTILSLCAGVLIFPIVFTAHVDPDTGAKLLFKTMPVLFGQMSFGYWLGLMFFVCLYFSALSGTITIYEGLVAYFMDEHKFSRPFATYVVAFISFVLGTASAFSGSLLRNIRLGDRGVIEIIDQVIINWLLPVVTLGVVVFIAFKVPEEVRREDFIDEKSLVSVRLYPTWSKMIKYGVIGILAAVFILQIVLAIRR